jgi:hypothetical protein
MRADHSESGQEETFLAIGGSGWMDIEGERVDLDGATFVQVGPETKRKIYSGAGGLRVRAIGGAPGEV